MSILYGCLLPYTYALPFCRLIKKGGEQVSPYEVEEALLNHPWVQVSCAATCF